MALKTKIIEALGETNLILPTLVNRALAANDRVKYLFTLLQMAKSRADFPDAEFTDLSRERLACGVEDASFDSVIAHSRRLANDTYHVEQAGRIYDLLLEDLGEMLKPVTANAEKAFANGAETNYVARFEKLTGSGTQVTDHTVNGAEINAMTSARREQGDSLHLLVMDLHKELNRLQARISEESFEGAQVYGIDETDRPLIKAFMQGIGLTAKLKFDHPGLGATATRLGEKLMIQNDLGTTDAHVLVTRIEGMAVTVICTDVHLQRLLFFQSLFEGFSVRWEDTRSRKDAAMEGGVYHLGLGSYRARDQAEMEGYLSFLGSRLVFLIDWNRARKRLQNFVPKSASVELLKWAADHNYGHMAFLKAGGEQLVFDAMEFVVKGQLHIGQKLYQILGAVQAQRYLQFVLKTCAEGLLEGKPEALIYDEVRAELFGYFRSAQQGLLDIAATHASLTIEIASGIRDSLIRASLPETATFIGRNAQRAKDWERKADELVNAARDAAKQTADADFFRELVEAADDIADDLEEAAFNLTLLPQPIVAPEVLRSFQELAGLLVQGAQEYLKALETARYINRGAAREDLQDFLEAVHRIMTIERQTDDAQRRAKGLLTAVARDFKQLFVYSETAKKLEEAADSLMRSGLMLRDYFLLKVMQR
ncbi:MAG: DUF47 family protein [Chloracidobacterium sp.]|nr:DUF47 family protein [Chloracidobacterium sp.]